jgi:hypothetical protein
VISLAVTATVGIWYWRRLAAVPVKPRIAAVSLRTVTLLFLTLLVADFAIEYQTVNPLRVLVTSIANLSKERSAVEDPARIETIACLKHKDIVAIPKDPAGDERAKPAAAILVTDGGVDSTTAQTSIDELNARSGPVYVVTDLATNAAPSVSVRDAQLVGPAFRGVPQIVTAVVHARGMAGRETLVTVADSAQVRSSAKIAWSADDETRSVELEVVPKAAGWQDYIVSAEPVATGQSVDTRSLSAFVEERQWLVLIFEGEPTSETSFIRRSLEQAGFFSVDYFAQVSRDAATGNRIPAETPDAITTAGSSTAGAPAARLHAIIGDAARLAQYDLVIAGPTPNGMLSAAEAERLRQWVDRRGGGLIILGGNNFSGSVVGANGRLASLLPAAIDAGSLVSPGAAPSLGRPVEADDYSTFALVPTATGAESALRGFVKARDSSTDRRDVLGLGLRLGAPRLRGVVLAVSGDAKAAISDQGRPQIAAAQFGLGRVLLFAPADSFKLKVSEAERPAGEIGPFDALWRGLTLWTSAGATPAAELALSNESPSTGEEVTVETRFRDAQFQAAQIASLAASWRSLPAGAEAPLGPERVLELLPDREQAGVWSAKFVAPAPGRYIFQATVKLATGSQQTLEKRFTVTPANAIEAGAARDTLERLARETGGGLYALNQLDQLAAQLSATPRVPPTISQRWRLRDFWPLALLLPLLLSAEWLIHRLKF